jgi:DNA repair exonuclease SbcCD ATPase subunit
MIPELQTRLHGLKSRYDRLAGQSDQLESNLRRVEAQVSKHQDEIRLLGETADLLQHLQRVLIDENIQEIEGLVSDALKEVFPDQNLGFKVEQIIERGRTSLNFYVMDNSFEPPAQREIMDCLGGGVVAVVSFLLRVIALKKLNLYPFLALDETFGQVSTDYIPNVSKLLRQLSERLGIDIFLVTHQEGFLSGAHRALIAEPHETKGLTIRCEDAV